MPTLTRNQTCGICKSKVAPNSSAKVDDWVECSCCSLRFHMHCVNLKPASAKKNFFCPDCIKESNFNAETATANVKKALIDSGDFLKLDADNIANFDAVIKSHVEKIWPFFNDKVQAAVINSTSQLVQRVNNLEALVAELNQKQQWLKNELQIGSRANNIVIRGVADNVHIDDIIGIISKLIGFNFRPGDVTSIRRISKAVNNKKFPCSIIIASFRDHITKYDFLKCFFQAIKRKVDVNMGLFLVDGCSGSTTEKVFISEHLDRATLNIFMKARKLKSLNLISYYILRKGFVFVKIRDNDELQQVKTIDQLDVLFPSASTRSER